MSHKPLAGPRRRGDIFVHHARRHADASTYLIPVANWQEQRPEVIRLTATPQEAESRLQEREAEIEVLAHQRDATYVLDEILANETELPILEHTTDTSGYTEIVFALKCGMRCCALSVALNSVGSPPRWLFRSYRPFHARANWPEPCRSTAELLKSFTF